MTPHLRLMYDQWCNTQHYFLGREPEFFKATQIFIDSFHSSHKHCSRAGVRHKYALLILKVHLQVHGHARL
jgi:hypothetical protein